MGVSGLSSAQLRDVAVAYLDARMVQAAEDHGHLLQEMAAFKRTLVLHDHDHTCPDLTRVWLWLEADGIEL